MIFYGLNIKAEIRKINSKDINKYVYLVICIGTMQFTTIYTFDHMPVGYALSLFQLSIIVSVLLGRHIFKERNIRKKLIGSFIMIAGSSCNYFIKRHLKQVQYANRQITQQAMDSKH